MRLGILDAELSICTIDGLEDLGAIQERRIREQMPERARLEDLAFFYMPDRDWIVVNRGHRLSGYYADIIKTYLELPPKGRKQCAACGEVRDALKILDDIIFRRRLIYGEVLPYLTEGRKEAAE
jgi:hypothetical protein|nr:hypothetical protein [uncultured Acetatifactor sp.]